MNFCSRIGAALTLVGLSWSSTLIADTLTNNLISQWLKSQPQVEAFGDKHDAQLSKYDSDIGAQGSLDAAYKQGIVALKESGLYDDFEDVIDDYGFDSPEQWSQVGSQIMSAYMAVEMAGQAPQMDQMMAQMQEMMSNDQIPAAQKEMMMNAMQQGKAMHESSKSVPQEDIDAIQPFLPQLRSMGEGSN